MSDISLLNKIKEFQEKHCYQYQRRIDTLQEDIETLGEEFISNVNINDIEFKFVEDKEERKELTKFIERYEWLGTIGSYPTHWFSARYKNVLCGVIIMSMPNSFSKLLGEDTKNIERLIARGASSSWSPKNLASKFLMWCIKYMVNNTPYRLFTCYGDTAAKELGTIYQSCNFFYLGQNSGTTVRCINPYNEEKIITDRAFRARSFYKRYAKDLGIEWQKNWSNDQSILWKNIPDDIEKQLRDYSKMMYKNAKKIEFPKKHKYAYVLGRNKAETYHLRKLFLEKNKTYPYPKNRGE